MVMSARCRIFTLALIILLIVTSFTVSVNTQGGTAALIALVMSPLQGAQRAVIRRQWTPAPKEEWLYSRGHWDFKDEKGEPMDKLGKEKNEHLVLQGLLIPGSVVLEVGPRYGTSSCVISKTIGQSGFRLSVEADPPIAKALKGNTQRNGCEGSVFNGVVAETPMKKAATRNGSPWTNHFEPVSPNQSNAPGVIEARTPEMLEQDFGHTFDTMVVDCEGCFVFILQAFKTFVGRMRLVYLEADYGLGWQKGGYADYVQVIKTMEEIGFRLTYYVDDLKFPNKIPFMVFEKAATLATVVGAFMAQVDHFFTRRHWAPAPPQEWLYSRGDWDFRDENGEPMHKLGKENDEHLVLQGLLTKGSVVLEVGPRYGTSSCVISKTIGESGFRLSVEADPPVANALEGNMQRNGCQGQVFNGVVAKTPMKKATTRNGSPWTNHFEPASPNESNTSGVIQARSPEMLERDFGCTFDTLVVDCEGCFVFILEAFQSFVGRMRLVYLEADYGLGWQKGGYADYVQVIKTMEELGFLLTYYIDDLKFPNKIPFMVFEKG